MEYRCLDITIISAEGLNDVNLMSKMDVYVVASISGVRKLTHIDKRGGKNPKWNHNIKFSVAESAVQQPHLCLLLQLRSDRVLGDKDIGYVSVPLRDLLSGNTASERVVEYAVQKPSGARKGTLKFSYKFDGKFTPPPSMAAPEKRHEPVMAYPPYGGASTAAAAPPGKGHEPVTAYPPHVGAPPAGVPMSYNQPPAYAYPPPPQHAAGYGYPAQPQAYPPPAMAGYGYPQVQKPNKNKNKFGMGMGMGAGLLGGLLVGDMLSDVGDMSGYDGGGFDGGFDF